MSHTLFEAPASRTRRAARGGVVFGSIVAHGALLFLIIALQFGAIESPAIARGLELFVVPDKLPVPPPPQAAAPATHAVPDSGGAPTVQPDTFTPEPDDTPRPVGGGVPGSIPVGGAGTPWSAGSGEPANALAPPPQPQQPPAVLRIGGNINAPERLAYVAPVYPPIAQKAKVEGTVVLEATIDERGNVRDVRVTQSIPLLDAAALAAVSKWRYTPTRLNGVAVPVVMTVRVAFSLR